MEPNLAARQSKLYGKSLSIAAERDDEIEDELTLGSSLSFC
jgi:hypothetical protein